MAHSLGWSGSEKLFAYRLQPVTQAHVLVEGWRFIPHSYSLINHFECLELQRRPNIRLRHRDLPPLFRGWERVSHLSDPASEAMIAGLEPPADDWFDVVYRLRYPFDLASSSSADRTCVFGTSEFGIVSPDMCLPQQSLRVSHRDSDVIIVTCSRWSRDGFLRGGAVPDRVAVVPLGVDTRVYHPADPVDRESYRKTLGWNGFVFLNVGAMSTNKGVDLLLRAFAAVLERYPDALLVLKGLDAMYESRQRVARSMSTLSADQQNRVKARLVYLGDPMSLVNVARLYQAVDAYVSPYLAEGFNMPVLEASACGLPVICTQGGPTDDFVDSSFAHKISSKLAPAAFVGDGVAKNLGFALKPDFDHLVQLMLSVVEQSSFVRTARVAGPKFVESRFTWAHVVDRLVGVLLPRSAKVLVHGG